VLLAALAGVAALLWQSSAYMKGDLFFEIRVLAIAQNSGPISYAYTAVPDLRTLCDWVRYESVATLHDCMND